MAEDSTRRLLKTFGVAVTNLEDALAAGEADRVVAYRLVVSGNLEGPTPTPFTATDQQQDSFPNDVAVATLPQACE